MLNAAALEHWREHAAQQAIEIDDLRERLTHAEDCAEEWQRIAERRGDRLAEALMPDVYAT